MRLWHGHPAACGSAGHRPRRALVAAAAFLLAAAAVPEAARGAWTPVAPGLGATMVVAGPADLTFAAAGGRLYRSADRGETWQPVGSLPSGLLGALPAAGALFAGGEEGLFRSTDGGRTWTPVFAALVHSATFGRDVSYLSDSANVYRSTDGGVTWELALPAGVYTPGVAADPGSGVIAFAASGAAVAKTVDGGSHWEPLLSTGANTVVQVAVAPSDAQVVYALDAAGNLFHSSDGGAHWVARPAIPTYRVVVDPLAADHLLTLAGGLLWASDDAGASWRQVATPAVGSAQLHTTLGSTPATWLVDGRTALFRSDDGGATWQRPFGRGLPTPVLSLVLRSGAPPTRWLATAGLFSNDGPGLPWRDHSAAMGSYHVRDVALAGPTLQVVFAASDRGILRSDDLGLTWTRLSARRGNDLAAVDARRLVLAGAGAAVSQDGGATWRTTLRRVVYDDGSDRAERTVERLVERPFAAASLCALSRVQTNRELAWGELHCSQDGGLTWRLAASDPTARGLALAIHRDGTLLLARPGAAGSGARLLASADGGRTWALLHTFPPAVATVADLAIDPRDPRRFYAATAGGVLRSNDGGATWRLLTTAGLERAGALDVSRLLLDWTGATAFAVGRQGGLFSLRVK